jgi:hypothetical protein
MAHRSIRDYIRPEIQDQAEKLIGRFSGHGEYLMTNISEGHEIEEMISSLIISSTGHPAWKEISRHGDLNVIIDELQRRALYGDRDAAWLKRTVIEGIFPLHPSALYVLLRLAEVVAQSERTVFRFFSFHQNGGLKHFVDTNDVLYGKRLNFYTVDHLFDYFKDDMERHRGRGRWAMEGFRLTASNSDIRESPQAIRVLKAIAVLQTIADQSKLKTSVEDLMFCLNIPISQRDSFVQLLLKLEQYGLFRAATRDYRFQRRGGVEPRELMEKKREELRNYFVLAKALKEILEEEAIEAQRYNERHGTNRMMPVTYASVGELAHPEAFINRIETSLHDLSRYHGDGMLIRVCPQTPEEVIRSQDMVKSEKWRHPFIIWQVPEAPPGYTEEILELIAWEDVLGEPSLKEDKDQLTEEVDIQRGKIIGKVKRYFSEASKFVWMGKELSGIETVEIVSRAFEQIFPKTPIISDKALAEHITGKDAEKTYRTNLVSQIISTGGRVELREKSRRAEDRMLRNLFLKNRMIREVSRGQFQVITPPPGVNIYEAWTTLDQVMKQQIVLADTVVERMCLKEYGLTLQTLDLLLGAYICDKSDLYYLVRSPTRWFRTKDMSLISLIDGQNLYNALRKPSEEYTFIFSEVTKDQRWLLEEVKRLFAPGWVPEANLPIWQQAYEALFDQWFKRVPIVSCALIPQKEVRDFIKQLNAIVSEAEDNVGQKARDAFRRAIPAVFGHEEGFIDARENGEDLLAELEMVKKEIDQFPNQYGDGIVERIGQLFNCDSRVHEDIYEAIKLWWNALPEHARVGLDSEQSFLKDTINGEGPARERYLCMLPERWGIRSYLEWESDKSDQFLTKMELVKTKLEGREPPPPPSLTLEIIMAELRRMVSSFKNRGADLDVIRKALKTIAEE